MCEMFNLHFVLACRFLNKQANKIKNSFTRIVLLFLFIYFIPAVYTQTIRTVGGVGANYTTLRLAFNAINAGVITGDIILQITGSTTETASALLYASGTGSSSYYSIQIYPTISGRTISGTVNGPLIDLNGADNVTIDGRVNATGFSKDLTIVNASTGNGGGNSTIRFVNDASLNTIKFCTIKGSTTNTSAGILLISTTTASTGNDGNTIDNNNITSASDANRPINAVFSQGTSTKENNGNTYSNNNIYDFLNRGTISNGINIFLNNTGETITGNSFYETTTFAPTASFAYNVILINNTSGNDFVITNNYIGGNAPLCSGVFTKTAGASPFYNNTFIAINLNVGNTSSSSIQNNTIQKIAWTNSAAASWTGISITLGAVNVGTITGNIIGANTGTGSITITGGATNTNVYGISIAGNGTISIHNNNIGSITAANTNASFASNIYGIYRANTVITSISGNTIGSLTESNSIQASSGSTANAQSVYGIFNASGGTSNIINNTIANLTNATTNSNTATAGLINGIRYSNGVIYATNNIVRNLSIANANSASNNTASVCGIALTSTNSLNTITGNTIYNLSNTNAAFGGSLIGLYFGATGTNHIVSTNFIHSLSVNAATSAASIYGIKINTGITTYSNNIISLGGNTASVLYGIFEPGVSANTNSLYFNTIYLSGAPVSGSLNSFALYSLASENNRRFSNNILFNARSNYGASGKHYGIYLNYGVSTGITLNYNNYFVTGTGGVLGYYNGADVGALPIITAFDAGSMSINPALENAGGTTATNYKPTSDKLGGFVVAGISTDFASMTRAASPTIGAYEVPLNLNVDVYKSSVFQASYFKLKDVLDKINNGTHTGELELKVKASTIETASAVIYQSGYTGAGGVSNYSSVSIYPTVSGLSISGNLNAAILDLQGADNVTLDGRVNQIGANNLTISNTNTSNTFPRAVLFQNGALNNTIKYCTIKGASTGSTGAVISFITGDGITGNNNNTIDHCYITNSGTRPTNAIFSQGTASIPNTGNIISNNNIFDIFRTDVNFSCGIDIESNSTNYTITGNSFYETTSLVPTVTSTNYYAISINNNSNSDLGNNFIINDNYIGGTAALCAGVAFSVNAPVTFTFHSIYFKGGSATASSIQNNTIKNINIASTSATPWYGINVINGAVNIGTITGNNIGETNTNNSVSLTNSNIDATSYGIYSASGSTVDIQKNRIGSVTTIGSALYSHSIICIYKSNNGGNFTVSNNVIGSTTRINSIQASSSSTSAVGQIVTGIMSNGTGNNTISNNTIANLYNAYSGGNSSSRTRGIDIIFGANTIQNNIIRDISSASGQEFNNNSASVIGIADASTSSLAQTIKGNTIYNLSNTNTTKKVDVYGIYFGGSTTGTNDISDNFIHSLILLTSNTESAIMGILTNTGASTIYNNIVNIGESVTNGITIYGINNQCGAGNNNKIYYNTVYVGGSLNPIVTTSTFALFELLNTSTRDYRNNILYNARTGGITGKHYAINLAGSSGITINYNDYFVASGGILGKIAGLNHSALDLSWKSATGGDFNSLNTNPGLMIAGSTTITDYMPTVSLFGLSGLGPILDIQGITRLTTPTIGAIERNQFWVGSVSSDFNDPLNWSNNAVPASGSSLLFADNPDRSCTLDMDRTIGTIVINQATDKFIVNGFKLTIKGSLSLFNLGQIDASESNSTVEFAGNVAQSISSGTFLNNEVYNLTINNSNNVILNGTLRLLNSLTTTSGRLDATTNSPLVIYGGTSAQTIGNGYLNDRLYDLTIDNIAGVTLTNSNLTTVTHDFSINNGMKFQIAPGNKFAVNGVLTNNAGVTGFVLQSDPTGTASLMHNTNSVPATVQRCISGGSTEAWHFLSSPVTAQAISGTWIPTGTYGNGTGYDLYVWNEPTSCWIFKHNITSTINWNTVHPGTDFVPGRGYLYSVQATNPVKEFVGNLNNGTITYGITAAGTNPSLIGFNLVSNPYASSIDWKSASGWSRSNLVITGGGYNVWIWNPTANNYGVYNSADAGDVGTLSVSRYIAPMQGYFVQASTSGNLAMNNSVRYSDGATDWLKSQKFVDNKIKLCVNSDSGNGSDEVKLGFGYDENENVAMKLFSNKLSAPSLYMPSNSNLFSVLNFTNTTENPNIPLMFIPGVDGKYTIDCNFDVNNFEVIMLEDCKIHYIQDLKISKSYNFTASKSDDSNRFVLHFGTSENQTNIRELPARIFNDGNQIIIDLTLIGKETETYVYDAMGRLFYQKTLQGEIQHKINIDIKSQILIIKLKNELGSICRKINYNYK